MLTLAHKWMGLQTCLILVIRLGNMLVVEQQKWIKLCVGLIYIMSLYKTTLPVVTRMIGHKLHDKDKTFHATSFRICLIY
jgi:hypothetical protein